MSLRVCEREDQLLDSGSHDLMQFSRRQKWGGQWQPEMCCTFGIPDVYAAIHEAGRNAAAVSVVGAGRHTDAARLLQLGLDDCLLGDQGSIPQPQCAILAACHSRAPAHIWQCAKAISASVC